jgi:hypothetical protein
MTAHEGLAATKQAATAETATINVAPAKLNLVAM